MISSNRGTRKNINHTGTDSESVLVIQNAKTNFDSDYLKNQSDVRPDRLHADSHGQSEAVFGLSWLLGIVLMPRIRNWRTLTLYSASEIAEFTRTRRIYGGTINWDIIADGWEDFLRMRLAIGSGRISPYGTHKWQRFGDYRFEYAAESFPETT